MENIEIQNNTNTEVAVNNFIEAICDDNHIYNYFATISMAVLPVVQAALQHSSKVMLNFDYTPSGPIFSIHSDDICFSRDSEIFADMFLFVEMLSDKYQLEDDGHTLQLLFAIRGIDAQEALRRTSVLERFYVPVQVLLPSC